VHVVLESSQEVQLAVSKKSRSRLDWICSEVHLAAHGEQEEGVPELRLFRGTERSVVKPEVHRFLSGVLTNGGKGSMFVTQCSTHRLPPGYRTRFPSLICHLKY